MLVSTVILDSANPALTVICANAPVIETPTSSTRTSAAFKKVFLAIFSPLLCGYKVWLSL
jgi:hypothetical protein